MNYLIDIKHSSFLRGRLPDVPWQVAILTGLLVCAFLMGQVGCGGGGMTPEKMRQMAISRPPDPEDETPAATNQIVRLATSTPENKKLSSHRDEDQSPSPDQSELLAGETSSERTDSMPGKRTVNTSPAKLSDTLAPPQQPLTDVQKAIHSAENMERIATAMVAYQKENKTFLPSAVFDNSGTPILSWRVLLLPHLGYQELYSQFDLKQPWYAPTNKRLMKHIPQVYQSPATFDEKTCYRVPVGSGTLNRGKRTVLPRRVEDGLQNTVMLLETDDATPWIQPNEYKVDLSSPSTGLGNLRHGDIYVGWANGMVGTVPRDTPANQLKAMFTPDAGEPFSAASITRPIDPGLIAQRAAPSPHSQKSQSQRSQLPHTQQQSVSAAVPTGTRQTHLVQLYKQAAAISLSNGNHADAWRWMLGAAAVGGISAADYSWKPALRRPSLGIHYALGTVRPPTAREPRGNEIVLLKTEDRTYREFVRHTEPFGELLLKSLKQSCQRTSINNFVPMLSNDRGSGRRKTKQTPLQVTYLVGTNQGKIRRKAIELGCDVLVFFEKENAATTIRNRRKSTVQASRITFSVEDLAREEKLLGPSRLSAESVGISSDQLKSDERFQEVVWEWRDLLEDGLSPDEWPTMLTKKLASHRVATLGKSDEPFPPRAIAEMQFYRNRNLIDGQQLLMAARDLVPENSAMALVLGAKKKQQRALRQWLPTEDPAQLVKSAAQRFASRTNDND